jgi:tetratricopeptide (TPR) repeat protein
VADNKHITSNGSNGQSSSGKRRPPRQPENQEVKFFELLGQGTQALQQGRIIEAMDLLEQAYELNPDNPDLLLNLGGAYILGKQWKKALAVLEPLSERQPSNPMVWTNLGAAYLGNPILATDEKQQRAIGAFKLAIALDPSAPNVAYNLGLIYRDRKEYEEAISWFQRALKTNPRDRDARNFIARLSQELRSGGSDPDIGT